MASTIGVNNGCPRAPAKTGDNPLTPRATLRCITVGSSLESTLHAQGGECRVAVVRSRGGRPASFLLVTQRIVSLMICAMPVKNWNVCDTLPHHLGS